MQDIPLVQDIMTPKVFSVKEDMTMEAALRSLLKHSHSGAPVVDNDGRLVGMLSEKDCLRMFFVGMYDRLPLGKVSQYMSKDVSTCDRYDDIYTVARVFFQNSFRRLPVVDLNGVMVGIISRRDVLMGSKRLWEESPVVREWTDAQYLTSEIQAALGPTHTPRTEEVRSDIY